MLKKIESLRQKPKHTRNAYAFWVALLVTLVIALLWSTSLSVTLSSTSKTNSVEQTESTKQESSFFHTLEELKKSMVSTFTDMRTSTQYVRKENPKEQVDQNTLDLQKIYDESLKKNKESSSGASHASSTAPSE